MLQDNNNIKLYLQDIIQVYVQSTFELNRDFYIWLPLKLISLLSTKFNYIVNIIKPFYNILEVQKH